MYFYELPEYLLKFWSVFGVNFIGTISDIYPCEIWHVLHIFPLDLQNSHVS